MKGVTHRFQLDSGYPNDIECQRLFYVTNRVVRDQDALQEKIFGVFEISIFFRDVKWLRGNVNKTEGTKRTYLTFIDTHCHEFEERGRSLAVTDLDTDPRLFVFLRQQWESREQKVELDELLADSLLLYALEDTDPDLGILLSRSEILKRMATYVTFPFRLLEPAIDRRLAVLSSKPDRRINHHTQEDKYCLPFETRLALKEKTFGRCRAP